MQVRELDAKGLKKSYKITVDAATINAQTEAELKIAGERVKIPGFRPGFIPMKVLQQRYGKSVKSDVLKQVIQNATGELMNDHKYRPAMTPKVNIDEYKEEGDLNFTIEFEVLPKVAPISFEKITLERSTFDIADSDIDEALVEIAARNPRLDRVKEGSKAQLGNIVFIDFKGSIDGKLFDGGTANDFRLELGSKQFIDNFEGQLVGAKEGEEKIVTVTFPEAYPAKELAGKEASFVVNVKEIYSKETPEVDDAFAKQRGFADARAFREAVRGQLLKEYNQVVRGQLKKELFDVLEEEATFDLPETMVELEFKNIWERLKVAQAEGDSSLAGKSDEELKDEYFKIAQRRVKLGILLAEVGNANNLQVSSEELNRALMQQISMFPGQEKQVMDFYRSNPDRVNDLRGPLMEEKAVDYILTKVKFTDSKVSLKELSAAGNDDESGGAGKKKSSGAKKTESRKESKKDESEAKSRTAQKKKSAEG